MGFFDIFRRPKPKPQNVSPPAGRQRQAVAASSEDWHAGQTLLDDFVVERVLGEGGMGKVYLAKSRTTGMRFAVKRAKGLSDGDRRNFLAELQTWIDLPEHPNLVPCRFFRTVGDEVLIFAEYAEGGSLKNWIDSRKLYEGGKEKALERILDTAIQFAWGLHCVHELGLVHQDVKPANVMMEKDAQSFKTKKSKLKSSDLQTQVARAVNNVLLLQQLPPGEQPGAGREPTVAVQGLKVRVTDYGLARARATAGEQYVPELGKSILVSSGGYTPAYCSPEQLSGRKLDRSTDVWSWGVSVMEMFQGGVTWQSGSVAAEALKAFLEHNGEEESIPAMPNNVAELLNSCFLEDPAHRWKSMEVIVEKLREVYKAVVGPAYNGALDKIEHRTAPQVRVGERRKREGTSWRDPREWLESALRAEGRDPGEAVKIMAQRASSRRGQLVADIAAYDEARRIYERLVKAGRKDLENDLATLCCDAAFVHETADDSSGALTLHDRAIQILEQLVNVEGRHELSNDLACGYYNKANVVNRLGDNRRALGLYDRATEILERLVNVEGRRELANDLATFYMGKAVAVRKLGDSPSAVGLYDRATEILERLVNVEGCRELANSLAGLYMNKAVAVGNLGDERAAVGLYERAIEILDRLVNVEGRRELANELAMLYMNKGNSVENLGDQWAALDLYDRAIEILERLVNVEGRIELANNLAVVYVNKANAVGNLGDQRAAVGIYDRAIEILERLVNVEGRRESANQLAVVYEKKAIAIENLGDNQAAVGLYDRAIEILERLVNVEGRRESANQLAVVYGKKAFAIGELGDNQAAVGLYDRAIESLERLVNVENRRELAGDLAKVKALRGVALIKSGNTDVGKRDARNAMVVLRAEVKRTNRADLKGTLDWTAMELGEQCR
jgi:serine/threonine protein kinase/lipopolysaccharide biosynthesis regulator YciM